MIIIESFNFDVFVAEIGLPNAGRLFSLKFTRSSPIRAYLAPHDVILLLYRDSSNKKKDNLNSLFNLIFVLAATVFRMPNSTNVQV